jgi:hypothetical protein
VECRHCGKAIKKNKNKECGPCSTNRKNGLLKQGNEQTDSESSPETCLSPSFSSLSAFLSPKRFEALTAATSLAQMASDFELAMQMATPMHTRAATMQPTEVVREQASQFMNIIDDETAKMNAANRVSAHQLQCKKRKWDEHQREMKKLER